jgi:DNA-binding protein H-NS
MPTTTFDERLAQMGRQIEELEAEGRSSPSEAKARVQRELDALRQQEASARAASEEPTDGFDEKFEQFQARLRVAQSAVAADLIENREKFENAVDEELRKWDAYFERLQAQTAMRAASTRQNAETAISELRRRRNEVAERLADARAASGETWDEQKHRLGIARDELERKADELSIRFK